MSRLRAKGGLTESYFRTGMGAIVWWTSKMYVLALCIAMLLPGMARAADQIITTIAGGWIGDNGPATSAGLAMPQAVTVDSSGYIYITDMSNNRIRKVDASGVITTVAGQGTSGYSGDGGQAASAHLSRPSSVVIDASGAIYISDAANSRIRRIDTSGVITTVAGNGTAGYSGDGGPAIDASISVAGRPQGGGIAVDASGNIYIADTNNSRIRKVDTLGTITTVAGNGTRMYSGDNGPATAASLNAPCGVSLDAAGNIYIADWGNNRIRKVDTSGIITTMAGNGSSLYSGDNGPAIAAGISRPQAVFADAFGNIYIADTSDRIRKVDPSGIITTVAGNGTAGYSGDGGPAISASLRTPQGVFVDASGNIYISDGINNRIRKVDGAGIINTVAGGWLGDGVPATAASLAGPKGVAFDASGNVYIADSNNQRIRKIDGAGVITTIAGNGSSAYSGDGGPAVSAGLNNPHGVAVAAAGIIYIADTTNNRVRKIDASGVITTVAGNGTSVFSGDNGPAAAASLSMPQAVAVDASGNIYIADSNHHRIRKVDTFGVITTVAGNGSTIYSGDGGPAISAGLSVPRGVAVDASGNIFIADTGHHRIRKVDASGIITTVAGNGIAGDSGDDGPAVSAMLNNPQGIAVDGAGNIYLSDSVNGRIRKVDMSGMITTVAGNGIDGYAGDGGPATSAMLSNPYGIAVNGFGNMYIADSSNSRIRLVGNGQTVSLREVVVDSSGNPIPGAYVMVVGDPSLSAYSDASGVFILPVPQGVPFSYSISKTGYRTLYPGSRTLTASSLTYRQRILYTDSEVAAWGVQPGFAAIRGRARDYTTGVFINNPAASAVSTLNPGVFYPVIYDAVCGTGTGTCYFTVINVEPYDPVVLTVSAPGYITVQSTLNPLPPDAVGSAMIRLQQMSADLSTWHRRDVQAQGNGLNAVTYGNDTYVAVGEVGEVFTSADGITWTQTASGTNNSLFGVAYGNNTFVAVGYAGTILTSSTGTNWTQVTAGTADSISAITFGNNMFVAVGADGVIVTSANGVDWTAGNSGTTNDLTGIAYGSAMFMAVGDAGTVLTSSDAVVWTPASPGPDNYFFGVTYGNNMFAAVVSGSIFVTSDGGGTWTQISQTIADQYGPPRPFGSVRRIGYGNNMFVAFSVTGHSLQYVSADGINWEEVRGGTYAALRSVTYGGNGFAAVGQGDLIVTSPDARAWTLRRPNANNTLAGAAYGNNGFVAVGPAGSVFSSQDGSIWTPANTGVLWNLNSVAYGNNIYAAVGDAGTIITSPDGSSWTTQPSGVSTYTYLDGITFGNNKFVAVGSSGTILTSTDGTVWALCSSGTATSYFHSVTYGNNRYVAVGTGNVIVTSNDGVTWTPVASGLTTGTLLSVAYGNGMFIAVGPGEVPIIASSDGITWNTVNPGVDPTSLYTIMFVNSEFVAGGSNGAIMTSQDGITWSPKLENMSMNSIRGIANGNNSLVAVGDGHLILQSGSSGATSYTITSTAGAGGSISPSGAVTVLSGGSQTFTIAPDPGYHVTDVLVDGSSDGAVTNFTFTDVTTNHTISASFVINTYVIAASAGANGMISPSGAVTANYGDSVTLTISPDPGYHIADVLVDGASVGAVISYTLNAVTSDHTINATFEINTYTINSSAGPNGSILPSGSLTVSHGGNGAFTITPDAGYHVADALVDGASIGAVMSYTFMNVTADHTITATFAINTYTITANAGQGGTIICTPSVVNYGSGSTCTVTSDIGDHISDILVDGASVGAVNSYTFTNVVGDHTVSAAFAINTYPIAATAGAGGSVICSPSTVDYGSNSTCPITPATGYHITDVLVDGASIGAVMSYTFMNVTADHTITATFAINTYTITANAGLGGAITCTPSIVNYGFSSTCTIMPDTGLHISDILVDGVSAGAMGSYAFTNVTANHSISASFMINRYTISVSRSGTGTGTITSAPAGISCGADCSEVYDFGTSVILTPTPDPDAVFTGWSGACSGTGSCALIVGADLTVSATFSRAITLTSPNGGENWIRGTIYAVTWTYAGNPGSVNIELLRAGVVQRMIASGVSIGSSGAGSYNWYIPKNEWGGSDYTIRITNTTNSSFTDVSDGPFIISK